MKYVWLLMYRDAVCRPGFKEGTAVIPPEEDTTQCLGFYSTEALAKEERARWVTNPNCKAYGEEGYFINKVPVDGKFTEEEEEGWSLHIEVSF